MTLEQLQSARADLMKARASSLRSFRDSNGEEVTYASERDMARAIAAIDREIAKLTSGDAPRIIRFSTSKGL